jgi:hypothetical protein
MNHNLFNEFPSTWLNILKFVGHRKPKYFAFRIFSLPPNSPPSRSCNQRWLHTEKEPGNNTAAFCIRDAVIPMKNMVFYCLHSQMQKIRQNCFCSSCTARSNEPANFNKN